MVSVVTGSYFQLHGQDIALCPKVEITHLDQDHDSSFNISYNIELRLFQSAEVRMRCQSQKDMLFKLRCQLLPLSLVLLVLHDQCARVKFNGWIIDSLVKYCF